ncbi:hypothetical protein BH11PSE11_BH11PSE11_20970 [soil metagenome]
MPANHSPLNATPFDTKPRHRQATSPIEIWGGLECSVARIGNRFRNQIVETGHYDRLDDLSAIASLGIRSLRYPLLWETVAPGAPGQNDWRWHDERIAELQRLDISPIAGLVHHGSGPMYTSLVDQAFPELLAQHAANVAARYPHITRFTPVNEPLTTARFSGMYGHWYPHGRDKPTFMRALITQCKGVALSMQAIRRITPNAQLIQTEDLGKAFSTPPLQYQADHENERRWLSFDLLCGHVDRTHPWYSDFVKNGISEDELDYFVDHPCPPDVFGINHYLTSERFLDHRVQLYPDHDHSGNDRDRYADLEAVRIDLPEGHVTGPYARLKEVWERYGAPIAITEAHHGCSRDEQLRWLMETWDAATRLRDDGVDIRALTVWALFGCVDWNTLLTQQRDFYESGAFDVRSTPPRQTVLAKAASSLAHFGKFDHPVLDHHGWWRRDERFYLPDEARSKAIPKHEVRPIAISGATGTLGQAFSRICQVRGLKHELLSRQEMDISDPASVEAALKQHKPWAVINTAGFVRVNDAEQEADRCFRENAQGAAVLARVCASLGIRYLTFSSDLVFDGTLGRAYVESDPVCPSGIYGSSKAEAERLVAQALPEALVIRTSAFFGPWDRYNFAHAVLTRLRAGQQVVASDQALVSPTYVPDLVHAALDLLIDDATDVWHLANQGVISWHELATQVAREARVGGEDLLVKAVNDEPAMTALSSERGLILPPLNSAIQRYVRDLAVAI